MQCWFTVRDFDGESNFKTDTTHNVASTLLCLLGYVRMNTYVRSIRGDLPKRMHGWCMIKAHQCHVYQVVLTLSKERLNILASVGLPVWISDLSVTMKHEYYLAKAIRDTALAAYSNPAVHGMTFSHFWDSNTTPDRALFQGFDFEVHVLVHIYCKRYIILNGF